MNDAVGRCDVREEFIDGLTDNLLQRQLVTYKLQGNVIDEQVASKVNGNEDCEPRLTRRTIFIRSWVSVFGSLRDESIL